MSHSIRPRWKLVLTGAAALLLAWGMLVGRASCQAPAADKPAADPPAADAPAAEPAADEPPVMLREYTEYRESPDAQGIMMPIEDDNKVRMRVAPLLNKGKFENDDDKKAFDEFYRFRIAEFTWKENLADLPKKRDNFKKRDLARLAKAEEGPALHDYLNNMLVTVLPKFAMNPAYHPAVRYNLMLLVATLDQREPESASNGVPAIPFPGALSVLVTAVTDGNQPDAVRIAAMDGILRHCALEIVPAARKEVAAMLEKVIGEKKPSPAGTPAGQLWLRHRAAQALGHMAAKWPEANRPEAVAALQQLIADEDAAFMFRADAAHSVGALEKSVFKGGALVRDLSTLIGRLAIGIATKAALPDAGKVNSENLTYCLLRTNSALKGQDPTRGLLAAATEPSTRTFVKGLADKIDGLISTANDQRLSDSDRATRLKDDGDRLNQWLEKSRTTLAGMN